jgi:SAM-dependent methyltransferase
VSYRRAALPELPLSGDFFDVVVAFGLIENLEDLVKEARRVLKEEGVLVISAPDKQTNDHDRGGIDGRGGVYVPEFRELLERHFGHVRMYRQGAVAGGFVFPASEEITGAPVEMACFSLTDPYLSAEPPPTRHVIAVCSDAEILGQEEQTYLVLDRDRRVFDESGERAVDVELLRGEIQRMQETEVQAFVDAVRIRYNLIQELPRYLPHMQNMIIELLIHRRNIIYGNIYAIRRKGARGLAKGVFKRSTAFYRRLKTRDSG